MPFYQQRGDISRKRHTQFRQPDGSLYHEELMGEKGFNRGSVVVVGLKM